MQGMQGWLSGLDDSCLGIDCIMCSSCVMLHLILTAANKQAAAHIAPPTLLDSAGHLCVVNADAACTDRHPADQGTAEQILNTCTANGVPMQKKQLCVNAMPRQSWVHPEMAASTLHKSNRQVCPQTQSCCNGMQGNRCMCCPV